MGRKNRRQAGWGTESFPAKNRYSLQAFCDIHNVEEKAAKGHNKERAGKQEAPREGEGESASDHFDPLFVRGWDIRYGGRFTRKAPFPFPGFESGVSRQSRNPEQGALGVGQQNMRKDLWDFHAAFCCGRLFVVGAESGEPSGNLDTDWFIPSGDWLRLAASRLGAKKKEIYPRVSARNPGGGPVRQVDGGKTAP